jgi:quercetin dioxygenase-like cupin family protein
MLDKADADKREGLFGGAGAVYVWDLLPDPIAPFSAVLACELEPGGSVGRHSQQRDPEIVICIAGEGVAEVSGNEHPLAPGATVSLPFGEPLALRNDSADEPLRYLIIKAQLPPTEGRPSLLL